MNKTTDAILADSDWTPIGTGQWRMRPTVRQLLDWMRSRFAPNEADGGVTLQNCDGVAIRLWMAHVDRELAELDGHLEQANAGAVVKTELMGRPLFFQRLELAAKDKIIAELEARCAAYEEAISQWVKADREYSACECTSPDDTELLDTKLKAVEDAAEELEHYAALIYAAKAKGQGEGA